MLSNAETRSRILIVEDEAIIAEEIHERLMGLNFKVVGIEDSGERAIEAAKRTKPDLVLMDIRLKGSMDGIEAANLIRQGFDVPIVYLTAHSDEATLQRAKQTAPLGYILKPFQERDLMVTIEMALHRHMLETQLKESRLRYSATLASIGDGVIAVDAEGCVSFLNPVAAALTGWRAEDALGLPAWQVFVVIDERVREPLENPLSVALERRAVVTLTKPMLLIAKDGSAIPIDDCAAPILDERGNVLGAVAAFRDIRRRRLAEDALRHAEDQLRQSQKLDSLGRLAVGVAHDFNNLLTVINGCTDLLLKRETFDEESKKMVRDVQSAGERAAELTRQLLLFGKRQHLDPRLVNLNSLVDEVKRMLGRLLGEQTVLDIQPGEGLEKVRIDPTQMEQVILNIAINARDAMPKGGRLSIRTENVDVTNADAEARPEMPPGRYVVLTVSDTGIGMDEATRARIFEPFFTTKSAEKGTGLGLATAYSAVKQAGGMIYVYTKPQGGSTFRIYLPAVRESARPEEKPVALVPGPHGDETILLAEDEEAVRLFTALVLQGLGYTVLPARDAEEALQIAERFDSAIELLLTDVVMPGMSGRDLAEKLALKRPEMTVIFLSGYGDETLSRHGMTGEERGYIQKPFTPTSLAHAVREALDRAKTPR